MIPAKIMVVEDERVVALHLRQQLNRLGYEVPAMATSGEQALKQANEHHPDVILMDIHIDGKMDGIEVAERLPTDLEIPVIYLTAYSDEPTLTRARATKPYGYLLKPFSERELHASIQMVLERRRANDVQRQSAKDLEALVEVRTAALEEQTAERLKAERSLHQSQKMEAIGQLTGGIAHDFNNALHVVLGNLELVRRSGELITPKPKQALDAAIHGGKRAATLTHRLLAFARRQPLAPKPINLNRMIVSMAEMLRRTLGESISIETVLAGGLWWTTADESQLEGALLNLVVNARDAMPEGGKLTIETANVELAPQTDGEPGPAPGQYTVITVGDTGVGMSKELILKAPEPFYTTKDVGHGTGLGLSQVEGFIKQSLGQMKIESELGQGTTVKLYLPRLPAGEQVLDDEPERVVYEAATHDELILVVEDDDAVRNYSSTVLRELGYGVVEASDGATALRMLEAQPKIRMLFTDIGLPGGLDGRQLAEEVRRLRPTLPVLFTTGYARDAIVREGRQASDGELLRKPFTYATLAEMIRKTLDQS